MWCFPEYEKDHASLKTVITDMFLGIFKFKKRQICKKT